MATVETINILGVFFEVRLGSSSVLFAFIAFITFTKRWFDQKSTFYAFSHKPLRAILESVA